MHTCNTNDLNTHCPICKTNHEIEFSEEFVRFKHYIVGHCPKCNYKIFISDNELMTSGIEIEKKLSELEKKVKIIS